MDQAMPQALATVAQQNGWTLLPETSTHINRLVIRSRTSTNLYTIAQTRKNGIWMCECLGYRGHRRRDAQGRVVCTHLEAVIPVFEAMLANPQPNPHSAAPVTRRLASGRQPQRTTTTVCVTHDSEIDAAALETAMRTALGRAFGDRVVSVVINRDI